ncbi:MAG: hypothetical protein EOO11_02580 [Chitinophagaceae bacterium]|nr:MAG: hypothetical protein EOO11_02580 [Chitinophagaceae bacterium]
MNPIRIALAALLLSAGTAQAQRTDNPWQLDVAAGLYSFYLPASGLHGERPELVAQAALAKPLGPAQRFSVGLQVGFARQNYLGNALYLQLVGQFTPVLANRIELGIGTGIGYRLGRQPEHPVRWTGGTKGKGLRGIVQVPLQLTAGYRSVYINRVEIRPYLGLQLQSLIRYAPGVPLLPAPALLLGLKIQKP